MSRNNIQNEGIILNKRTAVFVLACWSALSSVAWGNEARPLDLEEVVAIALQNNHTIERRAEDRDYAKWALSKARRQAGPSLTYNFTGGRGGTSDNGRPLTENNDYTNSVRMSFPLYHGGQLKNQRRGAEYALSAADLTLENTRQSVKLQAASAYYEILRCKAMVAVREEEVRTLQKHLDLSTVKYEEGVVARADILSSSVSLDNARQNLVKAQGDYEKALVALNNILGLPSATQWQVTSSLEFEKEDFDLDECMAYALANRPDYYSAAYGVKQAEFGVKEAKAGYRPSVDVAVSKSYEGDRAFDSNISRAWNAGISVSWSAFDNGVTSAGVHQAQAQLKKARSLEAQARDTLEKDVNDAYIDLKTAEENIKTTEAAVAKAAEDYELEQIRYEEGVGTNLDVMDAQEKLTTARMNHSTALYSYNAAKAAMEKAIGLPVDVQVSKYVEAVAAGKSSAKALQEAALSEKSNVDS